MLLTAIVMFSMLAAGAATDDCLSRWSVSGIRPGMSAQDLASHLSPPNGELVTRANGKLVGVDPDPTEFTSAISIGICVDDNGLVSLVALQFSGTEADLERDREQLSKRWSNGPELSLGVADWFSDTGTFAHYQAVVFDECGAHALIEWTENHAGITGLSVGIRPGSPEFISVVGDKYRISHEILGKVGWRYARCEP